MSVARGVQLRARTCHAFLMEPMHPLEDGPIHPFAEWPNELVDRAPGVYTVWKDGKLIYVGMAGRGVPVAEVDEDGKAIPQKTKGLHGRLNTHASGKRSGDQFCIYICDHYVVPTLTESHLEELRAGPSALLDGLTKKFIRDHLGFRWSRTPSGKAANALENEVKRGDLKADRPLLNPAKPPKPRGGTPKSSRTG